MNHVAHRFTDPPKQESYFARKVAELESKLGSIGTADDILTLSGTAALGYRQSLSINQKVGLNRNLSLIRSVRGLTKFTGPAATAVDVISIASSSHDYKSGSISGIQYAFNVGSAVAPIIIGAEFGAWYGAAAGIVISGGQFLYNQTQQFFDMTFRNMNPINLNNIGTLHSGFSMF